MTTADLPRQPDAARGMSLTEGESLTPPASPSSHSPASCDRCLYFDEQELAASAAGDYSRAVDMRIRRRLHLAPQPPSSLLAGPFN